MAQETQTQILCKPRVVGWRRRWDLDLLSEDFGGEREIEAGPLMAFFSHSFSLKYLTCQGAAF